MRIIVTSAILLLYTCINAQLDSIFDQGTWRTFILHLPSGYTSEKDYPIVINMHGLNSNATEQQIYSQFDAIGDAQQFIVLYPNAINESWALFNELDINFLSHLIDTMKTRYSCNDCLFFTGMSDGGFMSYTLACNFPGSINAIASVTGNMTTPLQASCNGPAGIPVMDFHGTADGVVPYNGTFGIPPIENTIQFWVDKNNCGQTADTLEIPDTHPEDGCTATRFAYADGINESKVIFYKITGGGHTWPGTFPVASLGNTCQDIDASELIGEFFKSYCEDVSAVASPASSLAIDIFPNPATDYFSLSIPDRIFNVTFFNAVGQTLKKYENVPGHLEVNAADLGPGFLLLQVEADGIILAAKKLVVLK